MPDPGLLDILWIVISAALVLTMQGGFLCLEAGLTRSKNSINVAMKNAVDFVVSMMAFWAIGFAIMFGDSLFGLVGSSRFFLQGQETPFALVFFLFQAMFCSTCVTIVSGAVAERMGFIAYVLVSGIIAAVIYPVAGHWAWNGLDTGTSGGWLGAAGFVDWAGSSVVHSVGGWFALALLLVIGPRAERFGPDGEVRDIAGSNLPLTAFGVLILWFGWLGFNGGSTLKLDDSIAMIVTNTSLAAAAGGTTALLISWRMSGLPLVPPMLNGILAGLVAITACAHAVTPASAVMIGAIGACLCLALDALMLRARIDDAVGAVPVHLGAGIWGILAVALFGIPERLDTGLSMFGQLQVQVQGILATALMAFVLPYLGLRVLARFMPLRVTAEEEVVGLNVAEHGARTEMHDFYEVMNKQARTGDLSLRVPEDPFTEVGQIGGRYNYVMDRLEDAMTRIQAIIATAHDAILIFDRVDRRVLFHNPVAESMFGYPGRSLLDMTMADLVPSMLVAMDLGDRHREVQGRRADGSIFPLEALLTLARSSNSEFIIGTFRDITERKRTENEIRASEERFRAVYENAALGMVVLHPSGRIADANPAFLRMIEQENGAAHLPPLAEIVHAEDLPGLTEDVSAVMHGKETEKLRELRCLCRSGMMIWARVAISRISMARFSEAMVLLLVEDITSARRAADAVRLSASVFESTNEPILIFDAHGAIEQANSAFCRITGYIPREIRGLDLQQISSGRHDPGFHDGIRRSVTEQGQWTGEIMIRRKNAELVPMGLSLSLVRDTDGTVRHQIGILTDLSERKKREEADWRKANFDEVTGLPNRRLFKDRLHQALEMAGRTGEGGALLFLDLDRFKLVNDTLGHHAGDELLRVVARRLSACVRASDTVARLGGDEFTIILHRVSRLEDLNTICQNIIHSVAQTVPVPGGDAHVSVSIGIALFPADGSDAETITRHADAALYLAKDEGRNNWQFFTADLNARVARRAEFEKDLRRAMAEKELFMAYQPQIDIATGDIVGVEALVRWRDPSGRLIQPDEFIPLAEEMNLIVPLGEYIMRAVAGDIRQWDALGLGRLRVAVNVSPKQVHHRIPLPHILRDIMTEAGVALERISVELTESSIMADEAHSYALLSELNDMGTEVALDDFGKGYSSLSRLKRLPINRLKLDKEFIADIPGDAGDCAMVKAMINMASGLGIEVVAEGVETEAQLGFLRDLGCQKAQGYLFSKPLPARDYVDLHLSWRERSALQEA
ncbi:ammonium transporter [Telmatospirillum sp. J64-1]|uniref:ammonium transporter n=1 Tax=Telmatospirillum sp. J64-1 TaxID=2502183 RepID=UPI00115CA061|nr:ammonium transporter [Telmatospirillum sp. J64-1]